MLKTQVVAFVKAVSAPAFDIRFDHTTQPHTPLFFMSQDTSSEATPSEATPSEAKPTAVSPTAVSPTEEAPPAPTSASSEPVTPTGDSEKSAGKTEPAPSPNVLDASEPPEKPGPVAVESAAEWHQKLFDKSLLKQSKLKNLVELIGGTKGHHCLDIGGDNGVVSLRLRELGGTWHSADINEKAVDSIGKLVGKENAFLMTDHRLPFNDATYDLVVIIDMLEHLDEDEAFVRECHRVLKPNGILIANVPHVKRFSFIRGLRKLLGLTDDLHGHVRPGYTEQELYDIMKDGFDITDSNTYNRFFVELVDTGVQFAGSFLGGGATAEGEVSKGNLIDAEDFTRYRKAFRFYNLVYPFLWIAAQLDRLLFWTSGYSLVVRSAARPWIPRRNVKLRDGRSISGATMNTKIGTATQWQ